MNDSTNASTNVPLTSPTDPSNPGQHAPRKPSSLGKIFIGADGLRAGWSLLIFLVLMIALLQGIGAAGRHLHLFPKLSPNATDISANFIWVAEFLPFLVTLFATWIMSKIEKRPISVYGLGGKRKLPHFLAGLAWGGTCLSILVLTLWKMGLLSFEGRLLFGSSVLRYGAVWFGGFLLVGLFEEYLTRGFLLYTLTRGLAGTCAWLFNTRHSKVFGFWTAAIILSFLFGLGHGKNPGESPIGLLSAGLASLVFCLSLWRTGSLWWAIGFHASWDWAQSFLYGVADSGLMVQHHLLATHPLGKPLISGGTTGPEGSIFALPTLVLVCLILVCTLPRTTYGDSSLVEAGKVSGAL